MLIYEKTVDGVRHLFGTLGNIPSDDDPQLTYKDANGKEIDNIAEFKLFYGTDKLMKASLQTLPTEEDIDVNVFIGDVVVIGDGGEEPTYRTSEFDFTLTSNLTQPLYITQSAPNALLVDWGDGFIEESPSDETVNFSHTYEEAGNYTVRITCAEGATWLLGNSLVNGFIGQYSTKSNTYPTLTRACLKGGAYLRTYSFTQCTELTSVTIGEPITDIPANAFFRCVALQNFDIPTSVTRIGAQAFKECTALNNIILPEDIAYIDDEAFHGCESLTSIVIPDKLGGISADCFNGCLSLSSVTIGVGVKKIWSGAFYLCPLSAVYIKDLSAWCKIGFLGASNPLSIAHNLYLNGNLVTSLYIPDDITYISSYAFAGASCIKNLILNEFVKWIGESAFSDTAISSVTIPYSVTEISNSAFVSCYNLKSVVVGTSSEMQTSLSSMGDACFAGCGELESFTIYDTHPPTLGNNGFLLVSINFKIYVPSSAVDAYKSASGWSDYADKIMAIPEE